MRARITWVWMHLVVCFTPDAVRWELALRECGCIWLYVLLLTLLDESSHYVSVDTFGCTGVCKIIKNVQIYTHIHTQIHAHKSTPKYWRMRNNCTTSDCLKRFVFQRCRLLLVVNVTKKHTQCKLCDIVRLWNGRSMSNYFAYASMFYSWRC
jgi:hypothetical protein